jgi:hypothetical protein
MLFFSCLFTGNRNHIYNNPRKGKTNFYQTIHTKFYYDQENKQTNQGFCDLLKQSR